MQSPILRILVFVVLMLVVTSVALAATAQSVPEAESFSPQNVFVVLESNSGWAKPTYEGLSCDGKFKILGAYSDTTTIRGTVSPDSALAIINELLALNFFELPSEFGSGRLQLKRSDNGQLHYLTETTIDGGSTRIELHVGQRDHVVILKYPAHGAPEALRRWERRFGDFMKASRGW